MTTNNVLKSLGGLTATLVMSVSTFAQSEIVYNNTSTPILTPNNANVIVNSSLLELGDSVTLSGLNRDLTRFEFEYATDLTPAANKVGLVHIFANDGAGGAPGTLLWESATFPLADGIKSVDISGISGVTLANSITWSFAVSGLGVGETAGLLLYNPPSVGTSDSNFWEKDAINWNSKVLDTGSGTIAANFGARITAVPEPTTVQLAILGALAAIGYGLNRRRS